RSFFSGHSSLSFASAGLICSHHLKLDLFESNGDEIACVMALTAATATATLRVVGDQHYLSDVVMGAVIGTSIGFGLPLLHHYRSSTPAETKSAFRWHILPTLGGISAGGTF
ncbi:MAG: phosphatase PAP2 family protein, partial [Polyangiales bacterium]